MGLIYDACYLEWTINFKVDSSVDSESYFKLTDKTDFSNQPTHGTFSDWNAPSFINMNGGQLVIKGSKVTGASIGFEGTLTYECTQHSGTVIKFYWNLNTIGSDSNTAQVTVTSTGTDDATGSFNVVCNKSIYKDTADASYMTQEFDSNSIPWKAEHTITQVGS